MNHSRFGDVPGSVEEVIAGAVAGLLVLLPGVKRLALVRPLPPAALARDDV